MRSWANGKRNPAHWFTPRPPTPGRVVRGFFFELLLYVWDVNLCNYDRKTDFKAFARY
jgi:hypothetical protein